MNKCLLVILVVLLFPLSRASAQCANNNTLLLSYSPTCNGTQQTITNCIYGGQYVAVTVTAGNVYTFSTCGNGAFDTEITIYNSGGGAALGYSDDFCSVQSTVTWTATFSGTLWVLVDAYPCSTNGTCIPLYVTCSTAPPPAAGDEPCTATPLTVNTSCVSVNGTTSGATATGSVAAPGCASYNGYDVWYTAVVPASGSLTIQTTAGVITDGGMAIYTGASCSALTMQQCIDDVNGNLMPSAVLGSLAPGSTVYIRFWEYGGDNNGSFSICAFDNSPPPNTACLSPLPDICSSACSLGTLPAPPPCVSGGTIATGGTLTFNLSNVGAIAENPYSTVVGCASPATDVWYRFQATGTQLVLAITSSAADPLNNPNISLYNGNNCNALLPLGCFNGSGGTLSQTYSPITPGDFYYLQISGGNVADVGNFTLAIHNNYDCDNCLLAEDLQVTPPPVNGTYAAGQTVQFCFTVSNYNQTAANWLHGIDLNFGAGWNMSTLTATSIPASCATTTGATWGFYNSVTGGYSGVNYGPGFWYETSSGSSSGAIDGNPGNNFGDVGVGSACPRTFCWQITTNPPGACTPGASLSVAINTLGDSESGSWGSPGCTNDPIVNFLATLACCAQPVITVTNTSCGLSTGRVVAAGQGSAPWHYVWANAGGTTLANHTNINGPDSITGLAAGNYFVTVTDNLGCSVATSITVNASAVASATAGNTGPYCAGQTIALSSSAGGTSYTWSGPGSFTSTQQNPTRANATVAMAGTYNVTVTFAAGCSATAITTVVVNALPVAAITPATVAICNGTSATLTASGGNTYSWSNSASTAAITVSPTSNTTYTVTVTDANTCTATASRLVTVNALPLAAISPATVTICNGASAILTANGGGTYAWSNAASTAAIAVNPATTTTYTVTVTNASNCTATASRIVTVNTLPVAAISPATVAICNGANATLTASGGTTYAWSNGGNSTAITVAPTSTTTYTVTVTDVNTCTATASRIVTVNPLPVASISPATVAICNGGSATLTAGGGTTYAWSNAASTAAITVSPTGNTTYTVTVTDANSCTATASRLVTVNPLPVAAISPATVEICNGASATLTAGGGGTYAWSNAANTAAITVNPTTTTTYTVTVTNASNCTATTSRIVTVNALPVAAINPATVAICNGASATLTASGGTTYAWSNAATSAAITVAPTTTTTYTVTVTDANTCTATASRIVTVNPLPVASISPATVSICNGTSATLTASGGATYAWSNAANTAAITVSPTTNTTYSVTVTDANSCTATASRLVTVNALPVAAISPATVTICNGTNATLTASGGTTYVWSNAASTAFITVAPTTTTTYTVTVTDANTCTATASRIVTVNPLPVASISPATVAICNGASATLTASGGTTYTWSNASTSAAITVSPTATTTYTVTVTDANTCTATASRIVTVNPLPVAAITPASATICNGTGTTLTSSGGTTYSWSNAANTSAISVSPSGTTTYSVTVTDANTCTATAAATVTVIPTMILSATPTNVSCNGGNNGGVSLTVSSGQSPYTYTWSNAAVVQNLVNVSAATYTVTVLDNSLCSATATTTVTQPTALSVSETHVNVVCSGGSTGSINISSTGGTPAYGFSWNDGSTLQNRVNLSAGTYSVTVTDANLCSASLTITITNGGSVVLSETHTDVLCNGGNTAGINVTVTGGVTPYTYNWNDAVVTEDRTNMIAGTYSVTVNDNNGCSTSLTVNISQPAVLTASETHTNVLCNAAGTGTITVTTTGGTNPLAFSWNDGVVTQNRSNLTAGNYALTVTDNNLCSTNLAVAITQPTAQVLTEQHSDVTCGGASAGAIDITNSGGVSPYTYHWNDGTATQDRANLTAGNYNLTVNDNNACTATIMVTIGAGTALVLSETHVNAACNGDANGSITLTATGATSPYTFGWNDGAVTQNRTNIVAGTYSVTAFDAATCTASLTVNINEPQQFGVSIVHTNVPCNGVSAGTITITPSGGTAPYNFTWNDGSIAQNRTLMPAGTYQVTVTDNHSCTFSIGAVVTQPAALSVTETHNDVLCNGNNTGSVNLNVTGGSTPYIYAWSDGNTGQNRTNIGAGNYAVTVTDNNACSVSVSATVTEPVALAVSATHTNVLCNGANSGTISVTATGGTNPLGFMWNDGVNTQNRSNISGGNYTLTVTDNNACSASVAAVVAEPAALGVTETHVNVLCNGALTGSININTSGGTLPYSYIWNDGDLLEDRSVLVAGNYSVTVTDANSCSVSRAVAITQPSALNVTETHVDVACSGGNTGSINITATGAVTPYAFSWNDGAVTEDRNNIPQGNYSVTVTDNNACSASAAVAIGSNSGLNIAETHTNVSCNGLSDGAVNVTVNGGVQPYGFVWNDGVITQNRTNLAAGTYSVSATDNNSCVITLSVNISQPTALLVTETHTNVLCNAGSSGAIDITATEATAPYSYLWNDAVVAEDRTAIPAGNYTVTVTDNNACTASVSVAITEPAALNLTETHIDVLCNGGATGSVNITSAGGTNPYTYMWNDAVVTEDRSNIAAGNYAVVVRDNNSCTSTLSVAISQPVALTATETHTNVLCNAGNDGTINVVANGGTPAYTYTWNDAAITPTRTNLTAGIYMVTVGDNNSCTTSLAVTLTQPAAISITHIESNVTCKGYSDGIITVAVAGGTPAYGYLWNDGVSGQNRLNVVAGNYVVTVTDNNLCTAVANVVVTEPAGMTLTTSYVNPSCETISPDGSITLNITGGSTPYQYNWSNGSAAANLANVAPGNYVVTVTDLNNCTTGASFTLVYQYNFTVQATPSVTIGFGENTTLGYVLTGVTGNYVSVWSPGSSLSCVDCVGPVATPTASTLYHILITNDAGCTATDTVSVYVVPDYTLFLPNAFSPNGDGVNDFFEMYGKLKSIAFLEIQVFDRWGEKVFESQDHHFAWDGTYKGLMENPGIFVWQLKVTFLDGHREELRKGSVTLIR